ncbi:hypothetical protein FACS1894217_15440 [Clostridia bacterium]|nr:hypothetical protein FACS1894217_15440 [Clostridia bacterium]
MKSKTTILIVAACVVQLALIGFFIFANQSGGLKWDTGTIMLPEPNSERSEPVSVWAMTPKDTNSVNALWYNTNLEKVSEMYMWHNKVYEGLKYEVVARSATFVKYKIYADNHAAWSVWVDTLPLVSGNTEPRIAIEQEG